jgi:hypothetical protein
MTDRPRRRWWRLLALAPVVTVAFVAYLWACGAIWWSPLGPPWVRGLALAAFLVAAVVSIARLRGLRRAGALAGLWLVPFAWFWFAPATNDADWQVPTSRATSIAVDGDVITVENVRNFHWRSDTDFDARWEPRTYDLSKIRTLDLFFSYWGPTLICHNFVSFGFEDGRQLIVSVEVRRKKGEVYATVPSLFREFELIYIFADELDVAYLRTNVWKEDVHLFRIDASEKAIRGLLVEYVNRANLMTNEPEWYNAVTNSCGVNVMQNAWAEGAKTPVSWRLLFNGQWPRYAYDKGLLSPGDSFEDVFRRSSIDARAQAVGYSPEYSTAIRTGGIERYTLPRRNAPLAPPTDPKATGAKR